MLSTLIYDVLIILTAGLFAGIVCRQIGTSVLIGYLVVGAVIGSNALGWVTDDNYEIEHIAETGVFLLLFSIGLEFSLEELLGLRRVFFLGGSVQMLLVAVPTALVMLAAGVDWQATLLIASACSFSSTVLVFKALSEWGQLDVPHGRCAIGILLFQDAALVPLLLIIPLITGGGEGAGVGEYLVLAATSLLFIVSVVVARRLVARWAIPLVAGYRSPDLIVLFTLITLGGITLAAYSLGLPPAIGAFAAGLIFSGNRWTHQIDALIFPFRESFAAIFFISLGLIANPMLVWLEPFTFLGGLLGIVVIKAIAASVALRLNGLPWRTATAMGVGLAHVGEFAFVLVLLGWEAGAITDLQYQRIVTISLSSLIVTPSLIRRGLHWIQSLTEEDPRTILADANAALGQKAVVIGAGPTGRQVASRLETAGHDVCIVDLSPVNLHSFSQQGFRTIAGDATQPEVLDHAHASWSSIVVICVSVDESAIHIARSVRKLNPRCTLLIRCRYQSNVAKLTRLGALRVISEEAKATEALLGVLSEHMPT